MDETKKIDVLAVMAEDADFIEGIGECADELRDAASAVTVLFVTARELVVELTRQSRPNSETVARFNAALAACGVSP